MGITELWLERALEVEISTLPVKIRPYDVSAILDSEGNILNPLLASIKKHIEDGEKLLPSLQKGFLANLESLPGLRRELNTILKRVILEPDLSKFDVDNFTLPEKVQIFTFLIGGEEGLARAELFSLQQGANLGTVQPG